MDIVLDLVPFQTMVFQSEKDFRDGARRSRGSRGGSPWAEGLGGFAPSVQGGVWGAAGNPMIRRREIKLSDRIKSV